MIQGLSAFIKERRNFMSRTSSMVKFDANWYQDKLAVLGIHQNILSKAIGVSDWSLSRYLCLEQIPLGRLNDMNDYIRQVEEKIKEDPNMSIIPYKRRTLSKDISLSELKQLRSEGLTYDEIAKRLDISKNTVARHLKGVAIEEKQPRNDSSKLRVDIPYRPHEAVMDIPWEKANEIITPYSEDAIVTHPESTKHALEELAKKFNPSTLKMTKEIIQWKFEGALCNYNVDKNTGEIEMVNGAICGLLDKNTISKFIAELNEIQQLLT